MDAPRREPRRGQHKEDHRQQAEPPPEHVEEGRDDPEEERQELVDRQQREVVVPGLAAALDLLLGEPVAERLPHAGAEADHVGEEGGVEQQEEAVEQRPRQQERLPLPPEAKECPGHEQDPGDNDREGVAALAARRAHRPAGERGVGHHRREQPDLVEHEAGNRGEERQRQRDQEDEEAQRRRQFMAVPGFFSLASLARWISLRGLAIRVGGGLRGGRGLAHSGAIGRPFGPERRLNRLVRGAHRPPAFRRPVGGPRGSPVEPARRAAGSSRPHRAGLRRSECRRATTRSGTGRRCPGK